MKTVVLFLDMQSIRMRERQEEEVRAIQWLPFETDRGSIDL